MARRLSGLVLLLVLVALGGAAPLAVGNKEHQQMMADLRMLQEQNQLLQAQLAALADALRSVTVRLDEQAGAARKGFADQKLLVDTLSTDLRVVREKVDETNVRLTSLSQEVEAVRMAIPSPQSAPPTSEPIDPSAPATPAGSAAPTGPGPAPVGPGVSPQRLFESARADYYAGQWTLAIQGFDTYIKTFPKSDLADDAQYYIGDTHYSAGQFKDALAAYDRLIATYPASNTLPDAYYKRGLALNSLGQVAQAKESFEYAMKNFPDSDAGRLARQALDRLNRPPR
jgi:tol-pal system protein YbgF